VHIFRLVEQLMIKVCRTHSPTSPDIYAGRLAQEGPDLPL
jgi:hypothetical protein